MRGAEQNSTKHGALEEIKLLWRMENALTVFVTMYKDVSSDWKRIILSSRWRRHCGTESDSVLNLKFENLKRSFDIFSSTVIHQSCLFSSPPKTLFFRNSNTSLHHQYKHATSLSYSSCLSSYHSCGLWQWRCCISWLQSNFYPRVGFHPILLWFF